MSSKITEENSKSIKSSLNANIRSIGSMKQLQAKIKDKLNELEENKKPLEYLKDRVNAGVYSEDELQKTLKLIQDTEKISEAILREVRPMNMALSSQIMSLGHKKKGGRRKSRRRQNNNKTKRKYK
jgi:hypothetical protein